MTDYTHIRMRISWVILSCVVAAVSCSDVTPASKEVTETPLPAAALTMARALNVENLPSDSQGRSATQEYQVGDATIVVRRRSKTPLAFPSLPQPVYITSSPLGVIGEDAKRTLVTKARGGRKIEIDSDGIPVVHGIRTPDTEEDKYFTWRNARVIRGMLVPYDARDARAVHSVKSQLQSSRQARAGEVMRPPVLDQGSTAVRAPVLQYAHPELGAQPALSAPDTTPTAQAVVYFARDNPQDIHNDHSPYPFEPAEILQHQQRHEESPLLHDKRYQQYELKLRPKKTPAYSHYEDVYSKPKRYQQYGQVKDYRNYKYLQPAEYDQSYSSYYVPEDSRPFWERFSEMIRSNVQTGMEKVQEITRPMVDPIMSASQAFSQNLGLGGSQRGAQEKVGVVGPILGATSVFPAIGLVAGGAALGLGAAAVGRYLENAHSQVVESKRLKRSLLTGGTPIAAVQEGVDESLDNMVHALEAGEQTFLSRLQSYGHHSWSEDTPCAKRIFCDVMTQQSEDSIILMEKKMGTFLSLVHPGVARALSDHMGEVMDAVRRRDCSSFTCPAQDIRRSSGVTGAAVAAPGGKPGPR